MKDKEVLKILVDGKFHQYLLKSEAHYISQMVAHFKKIEVELCLLSYKDYKLQFGK